LVAFVAIRRWRVLAGFTPVALVLGAVSVAIMGWRGPLDYARFVLHLEGTGARAFGPEAVPNLRGLVEQLPGLSPSGRWAALLILASSLVVSFVTLRRIHNGRDSVIFLSVLAAVTTILISFHALVYDISLLLPMALFLLSRTLGVGGAKIDAGTILLFTLLLLTPLYVFLWLVVERFVWFSLILLWLYLRLVLTPAPAEAPA
jgi:hypothetical protein